MLLFLIAALFLICGSDMATGGQLVVDLDRALRVHSVPNGDDSLVLVEASLPLNCALASAQPGLGSSLEKDLAPREVGNSIPSSEVLLAEIASLRRECESLRTLVKKEGRNSSFQSGPKSVSARSRAYPSCYWQRRHGQG